MKKVKKYPDVHSDDVKEIEANMFALVLLMPEFEFNKAWGKYDANIKRIADYFNVSMFAVRMRANSLGLLKL